MLKLVVIFTLIGATSGLWCSICIPHRKGNVTCKEDDGRHITRCEPPYDYACGYWNTGVSVWKLCLSKEVCDMEQSRANGIECCSTTACNNKLMPPSLMSSNGNTIELFSRLAFLCVFTVRILINIYIP